MTGLCGRAIFGPDGPPADPQNGHFRPFSAKNGHFRIFRRFDAPNSHVAKFVPWLIVVVLGHFGGQLFESEICLCYLNHNRRDTGASFGDFWRNYVFTIGNTYFSVFVDTSATRKCAFVPDYDLDSTDRFGERQALSLAVSACMRFIIFRFMCTHFRC